MKLGRMSEEEAKVHPKKHMLIECIGVTPSINILVYEGKVKKMIFLSFYRMDFIAR